MRTPGHEYLFKQLRTRPFDFFFSQFWLIVKRKGEVPYVIVHLQWLLPLSSLPWGQLAESSRKWETLPGFASAGSMTHISAARLKQNSFFCSVSFPSQRVDKPCHPAIAFRCLSFNSSPLLFVSVGRTAPSPTPTPHSLSALSLELILTPAAVWGVYPETRSFPRTFQDETQTPCYGSLNHFMFWFLPVSYPYSLAICPHSDNSHCYCHYYCCHWGFLSAKHFVCIMPVSPALVMYSVTLVSGSYPIAAQTHAFL